MHQLVTDRDLDALLDDIGDRRVVMLGEASHGTHEFYTWRTAISKRLIEEKGFRFIAVEGDWPDCYRINRYVKDRNEDGSVTDVLRAFDRWPTWMWSNWEVAALAGWLRDHNARTSANIGFYGLDVYSLWDSMRAMLDYLEQEDPAAARWVREAYQCFEPYQENEQVYARYAMSRSCKDEVVRMLKEIRARAQFLDGDPEAGLDAEQNAYIAVNAEKYYSSMVGFDNESWNIRDRHMMDTLDRLLQFHGRDAKGIVWAHNTHIGDARATDMRRAGMINIGQLGREHYGINQVYLAGFATHSGTVIAGDEWGAAMEVLETPPAKPGSIEDRLHHESASDRYYLFNDEHTAAAFEKPIGHRAIGVVYDPRQERLGNYVRSHLPRRYDAFIYLDRTQALHPLGLPPHNEKMPDTYPFGL